MPEIEDNHDIPPVIKLVSRRDNHIWLSDMITPETMMMISTLVYEANDWIANERWSPTHIYIHINSNGGDLFSAFQMEAIVKTSAVPIIAIIEGVCASAATVVAFCCTSQLITPYSLLLLHEITLGFFATNRTMVASQTLMNMCVANLQKLIFSVILSHDIVPDENKIKDWIESETWFDMKSACDAGLCTELTPEIAASIS